MIDAPPTTKNQLVLSLFPGIGILDKAFEEEGFCVVRGPDLLWGGDIKRFHAPAGRFIPDVPGYLVDPALCNNRWLGEVQSRLHRFSFGTRDGRRLHFRTLALENGEWDFRVCASDYKRGAPIKLASGGQLKANRPGALSMRFGRSLERNCELQGLPANFFENSPFTKKGAGEMLGNAVPYPLGRALAGAVREALQ